MDFKPIDKSIKDLLKSGHQFEIPRFQRAYSWEKRHYAEFLHDLISNLKVVNGRVEYNSYFVGTMLFIGNFLDSGSDKIKVVDGQQRLTTITILLSVMSDIFKSCNNETLAQRLFDYIMTRDDNGVDLRILVTRTNYPYFAYYIQDYDKKNLFGPSNEEEENIRQTYNYFYNQLEEKKLKRELSRNNSSVNLNSIPYVDILKALRDQILNCSFISISTSDTSQANMIFEILNAKGKRLDEVDLIKNKIFDVLRCEEPVDIANDLWTKIKKIIDDIDGGVGMSTFYRHFWSTVYKKSSSGRLYNDFKAKIKPATKEVYLRFLKQMYDFACFYDKIINPRIETYNNRSEYLWLVQSYKEINDTFGIVQVRVPLMALIYAKENRIIEMRYFKKAIQYLENFHFAFNVVVSDRGNKLDSIYSSFAIKLCNAESKAIANRIIDEELISKLEPLFPQFSSFSEAFVKFSYTKESQPFNVKAKYALRKINAYYFNSEIFEQGYTVEHIIPENSSPLTNNIGNLILLEEKLNLEASDLSYSNKRAVYKKSRSAWVSKFLNDYSDWSELKIESRAQILAEFYYTKILKRNIRELSFFKD